jgi:uncharacterized phiE125 gp8 family phage protein
LRLKLKTAPTLEPVTLDEARNHLKVDSADDNLLITALITTARQLAERETKRAFITQTWELILDAAGSEIEIPKPPLQSVVSIKVIDDAGNESVVDSSYYDVDASGNSPGRVKLKAGCTWPSHRGFASFIVEFNCGYGDTADKVPGMLKQAMLQIIGRLYDNRGSEDISRGSRRLYENWGSEYIPPGARALLWNFKVFRL